MIKLPNDYTRCHNLDCKFCGKCARFLQNDVGDYVSHCLNLCENDTDYPHFIEQEFVDED